MSVLKLLITYLEGDPPLHRPNIGGLVIASKGMIGWQWIDLLDPELIDILLCPPLTDAEEQSKYETIIQQVISPALTSFAQANTSLIKGTCMVFSLFRAAVTVTK